MNEHMAWKSNISVVLILWACYHVVQSSVTSGISALFELETSELLKHSEGIVGAFGDFNGDQRGDIFLISNDSRGISVLLAVEDKSYKRQTLLQINESVVITSIVPADFNGDVQMDMLVVTRSVAHKDGPYQVSVYWGDLATKSLVTPPYKLDVKLKDEPLVLDYNADMRPDLLGEPDTDTVSRKVWISQHNKTFTEGDFPQHGSESPAPFKIPQSHAFIDLNNDLAADLMLTTETGYEIWLNEDGKFRLNMTREYPPQLEVIGQSSFGDIDLDHQMLHIVPGCLDTDCSKSAIYVYDVKDEKWVERLGPDGFMMNEARWNFVPPSQSLYKDNLNQSFPITLRMGDYNLDGFIDTLAVLKGEDNGKPIQRIFLLDNVACDGEGCDGIKRTFQLHESDEFSDINRGVIVGTFYDIYEDGMPDIVMVTMKESVPHVTLMKNYKAMDNTFIKVTVVSGLCGGNCEKVTNPYGVNYPGPSVSYTTTKTDGSLQESCGTQLSQTAHFALQTPYQTFGLGPTPNFLDSLTAAIPKDSHAKRQKSFPFIIPNSQLIVIPHPLDDPSSWKLKLYVTPSQLIYVTGATLLGTCGFVAGIVGILHWREKREDFREKKQEAQRFHFDAM